ncbi:MAG: GAF domain-containing protein [Gemmatimonadota bacterium]|nr:GAF domain-containing protein [Gemmatimonadota bacterium]
MMNGGAIVSKLEAARGDGATRDALLREAVKLIEASKDDYDWVGVYLLDDGVLVLHNYIGEETEHTRIDVGDGVCGTAVAEDRDLNIPDVHAIENYIACSIGTASEIVVLIRDAEGDVVGQLDLDSDRRAAFGEQDETELRVVADWLGRLF